MRGKFSQQIIIINEDATLAREYLFRRQLFPIEIETGNVFTVILLSQKELQFSLYNAMPFYQNIKKEGVIL